MQQHHKKDAFFGLTVSKAQFLVCSEKNPDTERKGIYALDESFQAKREIVSGLRHLLKERYPQFWITQKTLTSNVDLTNDRPECNLYVFEVRHEQDFSTLRPTKLRFGLRPDVLSQTKSNA